MSLKNMTLIMRAYQLTASVQDRGFPGFEPILANAIPLAVLPFDNMSEAPRRRVFLRRFNRRPYHRTGEIAASLSYRSQLYFRYKGKSVKVQEAARELGRAMWWRAVFADTEIGFSYSAANRRRNWFHVWANSFDRESEDLFALQDEMVAAISGQFTFSLVDAAATKRRMAPTSSLKRTSTCFAVALLGDVLP